MYILFFNVIFEIAFVHVSRLNKTVLSLQRINNMYIGIVHACVISLCSS